MQKKSIDIQSFEQYKWNIERWLKINHVLNKRCVALVDSEEIRPPSTSIEKSYAGKLFNGLKLLILLRCLVASDTNLDTIQRDLATALIKFDFSHWHLAFCANQSTTTSRAVIYACNLSTKKEHSRLVDHSFRSIRLCRIFRAQFKI